MAIILEATKSISISAISTGTRFFEPKESAIDAMATSLEEVGQLTAIMVHYQTRGNYRLVAGQTRFKAAAKLGWTHIRADIVAGEAIDFRISEIAENLNRHGLTAEQRKKAKAEYKRLMQEKLASVEPAKGGRGHKGGLREAARQVGVSKDAAYRAKLSQNTKTATVSEPAATAAPAPNGPVSQPIAAPAAAAESLALAMRINPLTVRFTTEERECLKAFSQQCGKPLSDCVRMLVREALAAHGLGESYKSTSAVAPPPEDGGQAILAAIDDGSICTILKRWAKKNKYATRVEKAYSLIVPLVGDTPTAIINLSHEQKRVAKIEGRVDRVFTL